MEKCNEELADGALRSTPDSNAVAQTAGWCRIDISKLQRGTTASAIYRSSANVRPHVHVLVRISSDELGAREP
jgi:hypothetical protein